MCNKIDEGELAFLGIFFMKAEITDNRR